MIELSISVHDGEEATHVSTSTELDRVIQSAGEEARAHGMLNCILLETPNGNQLGMVVGGAETVLSFRYGHLDPPYPAHHFLHGGGRYGLQCLCNLDQLPATGAIVVATPLKIQRGSGSPLRVIALVAST